ncbi:MAG: hypothetical protein MUF64_03100 [Polyangiaceae bacterium]|nr:hypothetical protein [Polyangiaceae bacterium]
MRLRPPPFPLAASSQSDFYQRQREDAPRPTSGVQTRARETRTVGWFKEQQDWLEVLGWNLEQARQILRDPKDAAQLRAVAQEAVNQALLCCRESLEALQREPHEVVEESIALFDLAREVLRAVRPRLEERLVLHTALEGSEARVQGDPRMLRGLVLGLLLDVYRQTPEGEPWKHDLVLRGRLHGSGVELELQLLRGRDGYQGPSWSPERWAHHAATLEHHEGRLEVAEFAQCRSVKIALPSRRSERPPSADERPTTKLPLGKKKVPDDVHERVTIRPPRSKK